MLYTFIALVVGFFIGRLFQRSKTMQSEVASLEQKIKDTITEKINELKEKKE
jgi:uncharacterized membrane-anchored protein YhcB (DUF1043 family)